MALNIDRSNTDPFYRYKMPRIIAKVEGKGNGIKTVIVNMSDVAKSLSRPPTYTTKFFGCELGAQTQVDAKNERFIVNGSHDAPKLQDLLDIFIKKFVLCNECGNPETNLAVSIKKQVIGQVCIACGHIDNIDMRHKLTTFILKNPPDMDPNAATPGKKDKKQRRAAKNQKVNGEDSGRGSPEGKDGEESLTPPQQYSRQTSSQPEEEDDDDWGDEVDDEAVKKRMDELTDAAKSLAFTDDLEKTPQERLNIFYEYIKEKKRTGLAGADKEVLAKAEHLEIKDKAPLILVELLLDENASQRVKEHRILFLRFTHENPKAQKYLLGALEQLVGTVHRDKLMPKVPHILKAFYDCDILDEEVIIDWDKKVSKKYVSKEISTEIHQKAAPFIKWLQEAESESEEDDDEEEDLEVVYSDRGPASMKAELVEAPKPKAAAPAPQEEEEDDFDIDAI